MAPLTFRVKQMLFPTVDFAVFFVVVLTANWFLMPHQKAWRIVMLAASFFFYGSWDYRFTALLAGSILINQAFAVAIHRSTGRRRHGLVSVIDNTFATPVNFRPAEMRFDLVVHSATKYLNGHSDLVAGAVIGSSAAVDRVRHLLLHLGGSLDPNTCFLLERGLKTLSLRVRRQNETAMQLARFLEGHPSVRGVNYPGLSSSPSHLFASRYFSGFGGMLSFYLEDAASAERFLSRLTVPVHAASLGGVESLVVRPSRSSHLGLEEEVRNQLGITDDLIRVSVGIEDAEELIADFEQALIV